MTRQSQFAFPLAAMAVALLAVFGPAHAQQNRDLAWLTKPSSTMSIGAGYLSGDAPNFGRYTGLREEGAYGLLNIDINKLDTTTGTWTRFKGGNLGLENRDLRFQHERQGDWGYTIDYSETPRFEPYTVNTAVTGIGTPNLVIPTSAAAVEVPTQLKMKRESLGMGFTKQLGRGFDLQVRARNEEKDGSRIFGRGAGTNAFEFTPEPIHSTTRELEAILGYADKKLQVSGIYYGTAYDNRNPALRLTGGGSALASFNPIGLPPDSQSHQLALDGGYNFSPTTRGTFKLAYTRATQNDDFITGVTLANGINAVDNLHGRMDTTQLQFGVTALPMPKLSVLADVRYEDREDKTPVRLYTQAGVSPTSTYTGLYEPHSLKSTTGKLEATYQLPKAIRMTAGIDYVQKDRTAPVIRAVSFRDRTTETSYRLGFKRTISETVSGAVTYVHSDRTGSDFQTNVLNCGSVTCTSGTTVSSAFNLIAPLNLADRQRDKLRLSMNWQASEALAVQFMADQTWDDYASRTADDFGLRDGGSKNYSIDASYAFSDEWQGSAWFSKNDTSANRATRTTPTTPWSSTLLNNANSIGIGLRGNPTSRLEIGMDLSHSEIADIYRLQALAGAAVSSLPDVYTRQSNVKLYAIYALQKNTSIRFDFVHDRYSTNDWSWSSWAYSDGTTLTQRPQQDVNFLGVTYIYRFQ
ncbi:MtrB/PioB family decaheme-associated outer membrane protein [Herbaspirillum sp. ST 5-3]|uniref:MtrB/PioB family decaheme-associated outer membrane protein n=1 Tax=Oxalobacteraceae TaxID=75682 RepID=UPI0014560085|nr:MtrB/PioB family decaheme-associated outer membrane protein [Herbaspirillum sp. ST 5-3]